MIRESFLRNYSINKIYHQVDDEKKRLKVYYQSYFQKIRLNEAKENKRNAVLNRIKLYEQNHSHNQSHEYISQSSRRPSTFPHNDPSITYKGKPRAFIRIKKMNIFSNTSENDLHFPQNALKHSLTAIEDQQFIKERYIHLENQKESPRIVTKGGIPSSESIMKPKIFRQKHVNHELTQSCDEKQESTQIKHCFEDDPNEIKFKPWQTYNPRSNRSPNKQMFKKKLSRKENFVFYLRGIKAEKIV